MNISLLFSFKWLDINRFLIEAVSEHSLYRASVKAVFRHSLYQKPVDIKAFKRDIQVLHNPERASQAEPCKLLAMQHTGLTINREEAMYQRPQ